jgi:hypothetical protein
MLFFGGEMVSIAEFHRILQATALPHVRVTFRLLGSSLQTTGAAV